MDGLDINTAAAAPLTGYRGVAPVKPRRPWFSRHIKLLSFLLFVMVPTVVTAVYLCAFASDQYVSEAKYVVRGLNAQSPGMLNSLLQTAGVTRAQDDTYAVQDYMQSRDALEQLIKNEGIRKVFDRPGADPVFRFPNFFSGHTFEYFYKYYQDHVSVLLDTTTGVTTMTVRTFTPQDSQRIANALLEGAEGLVNRMNERQRENAVRDARKEVGLAEQRLEKIATQIAEFRNREAVLDPTKQSVPMLQAINQLQTILSRVNLQIAQLTVSSPHSPLIVEYKRRADALRDQIAEAKSKVTGSDKSLVPQITEFDRLTLQREFADRQLASATTSLENARMEAERQQLYIDLIVTPNLSDYAAYPKRVVWTAIVFASALSLYVMAWLLISGAREHRIV